MNLDVTADDSCLDPHVSCVKTSHPAAPLDVNSEQRSVRQSMMSGPHRVDSAHTLTTFGTSGKFIRTSRSGGLVPSGTALLGHRSHCQPAATTLRRRRTQLSSTEVSTRAAGVTLDRYGHLCDSGVDSAGHAINEAITVICGQNVGTDISIGRHLRAVGADDLQQHWWARTVSNRRPLVCKSEPEGPPRFTRFHSVFKCAGQRVVSIHPVHGLSGCFGSS